jgi:hypothetical protein
VDEGGALRREAGARIDRWLAAVDRAVARGFDRVEDREVLPAGARADSWFWCDEVLAPHANPHDAPGARASVHPATPTTVDLLRHDYKAAGLGLTVIEGRNFLLVQVDPASADVLALPPEDRAAAVHRVASAIFKARPSFQVPRAIEEGARFSTDEGVDPRLMAHWSRRLDGGVRGGRLWFLCYKKAPQRVGFAREEGWIRVSSARDRTRRRRPR